MPNDEKRLLELVGQLQKGDLTAFDELYATTKRSVFFSAYAICKDKALIEDMMQSTYADFLKSLSSFKGSETVTAYLCRMIHNKMLNEPKKREKEVPLETYLSEDNEPAEEEKPGEEGLLKLARTELAAEEYQIVILHAVNELKFRQISPIVHKPLGTVLWIYNKAIKKLQKFLKEEDK